MKNILLVALDFIPRWEMRGLSSKGPTDLTYLLFVEISLLGEPFFSLKKVLSPEGRCAAYPAGPIELTYPLFFVVKVYRAFKITILR